MRMLRIKALLFLMSIPACLRGLLNPMVLLWILYPAVSKANVILYTLTTNYTTADSAAPGTVLDWQFSTPSILTSSLVIGSFLSNSVGGDLTGCTIASATVPSGLGVTSPSITSVQTSFASPCSTIPHDVGLVIGAIADFQQSITSLGTYTAYYKNGVTPIGTLTIADELTLQGGPSSAPILLNVPLVAQVSGTIGGQGSQDNYLFDWGGGEFSATGGIGGTPNPGASYLFSAGTVGSCNSRGSATLNSGDSFTSTIAIANLAPGQYCIGIDANNSSDPTFALTFNTPVSGVPEPSGFVLLSIGLGLMGVLVLRKRIRPRAP
jgi:hypothetical protein